MQKSLNIKGKIVSLDTPKVMGILNVTPDSFFIDSRKQGQQAIENRIEQILDQGADMIDIGGYSTRPSAASVPPEQEMLRLSAGLEILARHYPDTIVSVDTFRSAVARRCVEQYGVAIINDISGGDMDPEMFDAVAFLGVPYILMHLHGTLQTMQQHIPTDDMAETVLLDLTKKVERLRLLGVNDVILDPGFGFGKTTEQNYFLMSRLKEFASLALPLLVGVSRKRMVYHLLGGTPGSSLNGTTVLHTFALLHGADILRVHDVKEAVEAVKIVQQLAQSL